MQQNIIAGIEHCVDGGVEHESQLSFSKPSSANQTLIVPRPQTMSTHGQTRQPTLATNGVVTIDDPCGKRLMDTGVIIGRALPHCCQDTNVRPTLRAIITKVGAIYAYIPAKYTKRTASKLGVQKVVSSIEFTEEDQSEERREESDVIEKEMQITH